MTLVYSKQNKKTNPNVNTKTKETKDSKTSTKTSNSKEEQEKAKQADINNTNIKQEESETLAKLNTFVDSLKTRINKNSMYIPRIKLRLGSLTIDTANTFNNLFLSMTHNRNGSGLAGQCTFTIAYVPDTEMHMLNGNAANDVNYLDKILCNPYQTAKFSYGYAYPQSTMSDEYDLMITKYSVEIQNATLIYTIEASASLVNLKETLFDIYGDQDGNQFTNMRPTEVVYKLYEQYLKPLGYDFEWGPDTQNTDTVVKEFPRVSQINLFDYIDSLLKEAKYEKDTEDTEENETSTYHMLVSSKSKKQKIRIYRLCSSGENKTLIDSKVNIVFDWMNGKDDLVLDFRTEFNGVIPMSQIYAKEGTNPKFNLNDGNKFIAYLGTRAPSVGNKAGNLSDEDDGPITGSNGSGMGIADGSTAGAITAGTTINIPSGLGSEFTYMGWQAITDSSSTQYKLRSQAGMNFNGDGFGIINGRYVIACTSTFGTIGDYVDFYQSNGNIFKCVIGDEKSQVYCDWDHNPANKWGHDEGHNVIEFIKDSGHKWPDNPGNPSWYPQWGGQTMVKAVNGGNYFTNPNGPATNSGSSSSNKTSSSKKSRAKTNNNSSTSTTKETKSKKTKTSKEVSNTSSKDTDTNVYGADYISEKSIWTQYSTYSYKATLTTLGIPVDIPLMTKFTIIPLLYGKAHHTQGVYMVTSMTDTIDSSGFTTTFNLIKLYAEEINNYYSDKFTKSVIKYLKKTGLYVKNKKQLVDMMGQQVGNVNVGSGSGLTSSGSSSSGGGQLYTGDATGIARTFLQIAYGEVGYHEKSSADNLDTPNAPNDGSGNYTKYWRDMNGGDPGGSECPWCACFVSWCARKANIPESNIPTAMSCEEIYSGMAKQFGPGVNPSELKPGYLFFKGPGDHIGIFVKDLGGGVFEAVEGNSNDQVNNSTWRSYSDCYFGGWYS